MMREQIVRFAEQFAWEPEVGNGNIPGGFKKFVVVGMGGSGLAARLLKTRRPELDLVVHNGYGLPLPPEKLKDALIILSSYSGNTEETIDAFYEAGRNGLSRAVVSAGGRIMELAEKEKTPSVKLPNAGIQPRMALGFSFKALLKIMGEGDALKEASELSKILRPADGEGPGRQLAEKLRGAVPVIYSSDRNFGIVYAWKVKLNETAKIPAFGNVIPELNHNEMTGFGDKERVPQNFHFVFLTDEADEPRVKKRMAVTENILRERGWPVDISALEGRSGLCKIFNSLLAADWTSFYLAELDGVDPEKVPLVEEFKKMI